MEQIKKRNVKTNKIINGETVSYTLMSSISILLLLAIKQLLKVFIGIDASVSVLIAFLISQVISYILEKRFVFRKNVLSSNLKQILMLVFRGAVDFGFFKISDYLFGNMLEMVNAFVWLVAISICFFFNYFFDRLLLFDCAYSPESVKYSRIYRLFYNNRYVIFSGIFTAVCMLVVYIGYSAFPFGDYTILRMDLYHQYGPLFAELYERVVNHHSFMYSWMSGGGSCFLGNYFNYLSSPLTTIIFFFDKADIANAINVLVLVKCALSATTFTYYLKASQKSNNFFAASFGTLYALSAYFLAYYWNVMWLDGMILLPLIALGIENIINNGKGSLYIAVMAILFVSSYYMGFMSCIFAVIYFLAYIVMISVGTSNKGKIGLTQKSAKERYTVKNLMKNKFINRGVNFAFSSIAAAALAAIALVPVFIILRSSSATTDTFPNSFKSYFNIFDFITSHLPGLETTIRSSGDDVLPNVFSGTITLLLIPLFIINKEIRFKEKMVYVVLLLFLLFSFDNNCMNYLWHAMHFPNDLPFRFSYMYSFFALTAGYKCLSKIRALEIRDICYVGLAWIFFICVAQKMMTNKMSEPTIYVSIAFVVIWTGFLYLFKSSKIDKVFLYFLSLIMIFAEVVTADITAFQIGQKNDVYKENYAAYTEAFATLRSDDEDFYREELSYLETRMDPCYFGYNGMSNFSSMAFEKYSQLQYRLGMFGNRINSYTYNYQTPVYNMMFNIKYILHCDDTIMPDEHLYDYMLTTSDGSTDAYRNRYYLPIAYCASNELEDWSCEEGDPFEEQEKYFRLATGYDGIFDTVDYLDTEFDCVGGDTVTSNGYYTFYKENENDDYGYAYIKLTPVKSGEMYVYVDTDDFEKMEFDTPDNPDVPVDIAEYHNHIIDLGYVEEGEEVTLSLDFQGMDDADGSINLYTYTFNEEAFIKGYNKLKECAIDVTSYSDTKITGTIEAKEDSYLCTSIPYDKGWTIKIDGEEVEAFAIGGDDADALLTAAVKKGEHTVEFSYKARGFAEGAAISAVSVIALAGFYVIKNSKKFKDKKNSVLPA